MISAPSSAVSVFFFFEVGNCFALLPAASSTSRKRQATFSFAAIAAVRRRPCSHSLTHELLSLFRVSADLKQPACVCVSCTNNLSFGWRFLLLLFLSIFYRFCSFSLAAAFLFLSASILATLIICQSRTFYLLSILSLSPMLIVQSNLFVYLFSLYLATSLSFSPIYSSRLVRSGHH